MSLAALPAVLAVIAQDDAEHHAAETHHWVLPEGFELLFGGIASLAILITLI